MAGDAFFQKSNKRKRTGGAPLASTNSGNRFGPKKFSKTSDSNSKGSSKPTRRKDKESDDESDGGDIDDMDLREDAVDDKESGDEVENETAAAKRLRLAKIYLDSVRNELADGEVDAAEIDQDLIASRLKQDVAQHSGKVYLFIASTLPKTSTPPCLRTRGHRLPVTSAVLSSDGLTLYTSGKEGSIRKWDLSTGTGKCVASSPKLRVEKSAKNKGKQKAASEDIHGHTDEVLALALSDDGKFLASGGRDRTLGVWDVEGEGTFKWLKGFSGHRDTISAMKFRTASHMLYTGSSDRTLKLFDLSIMSYVETLFGHQDSITALDALRTETAISAGGQDRTVRYWKVVDESQLVFRGGGRSKVREVLEGGLGVEEDGEEGDLMDLDNDASTKKQGKDKVVKKDAFIEGRIDCVAMLDESTFLSGGDSGSIALWSTTKKKAIFTHALAHGFDSHTSATGAIRNPRWITSLAALPYSDLFASGSWDGTIRLWRVDPSLRSFEPLRTIDAAGFVNSLQIVRPELSSSEQRNGNGKKERDVLVVAGMGQEPKLGRWLTLKDGVRNGAMVFSLMKDTLEAGVNDGEVDMGVEGGEQ